MNQVKMNLIEDGKILQIRIPMKFTRRNGRKKIVLKQVIQPGESPPLRSSENIQLVLAIARAHRWLDLIDRGEVPSITALAKRLNQDISYVSRLIRFAFLAPCLVQAILDGNEPSGLSMAKLRKGIPELWTDQWTRFQLKKPLV